MMKGFRFACIPLVIAAFLLCTFAAQAPAAQPKLFKLDTCWMPSTETFVAWYAKQRGWDKQEGLDLVLHFFNSGPAQMEGIPARAWVLGSTGGVGQIIGSLRYGALLVGISYMDTRTEAMMVRADSPLLKVKGWNPKYPDVYGSPKLIKGKTFLVTMATSSEYTLDKYLSVFGLTEKDVVIKNMSNPSALAAYASGVGDAVALWAPFEYVGLQKGWKIAGDLHSCHAPLMTTLIGVKSFCQKHPEIVARFLRMYIRTQDYINKQGPKMAPELIKFYKEWAGFQMTPASARLELKMRPLLSYQEQLNDLKGSPFHSKAYFWQKDLANFFTSVGKFTPQERDKVLKMPYITDKYLKMVKLPIPQ